MTAAGDQYRRQADSFERLVAGTAPALWDARSPCEGWTARDVVAHVTGFTAKVLVEDAGIDDRVLGFLGRDPNWKRP